jgi:hypothetical protein
MRKMILAAGAAGVVMTGAVSLAQAEVVLTGSLLADLTYNPSALSSGATAGYSGGNAVLTNPDTNGGFFDTSEVLVPNGYDGVSLGTLNTLLSAGTAGNVSFDLLSGTPVNPGNNYAYWDVVLQNPSNSSQTIVWNAYGINATGPNPFNQGLSTNASCNSSGGCVFSAWNPNVTSTYGTWNVIDVSIGIGGWANPNGTVAAATIDSISLPGTLTPLPAALPLFAGGLGLMGLLGWRRKQRGQAAA